MTSVIYDMLFVQLNQVPHLAGMKIAAAAGRGRAARGPARRHAYQFASRAPQFHARMALADADGHDPYKFDNDSKSIKCS